MGLSIDVPREGACPLVPVLHRLAASGFVCVVAMVDGQLVPPRAPAPVEWREVRLRTPAGMVTLARRAGGVSVSVFGNADAALQEAQRRVADALVEPAAT